MKQETFPMDLNQRIDMTETLAKVESEVHAMVERMLPSPRDVVTKEEIEEAIASTFGRRYQMISRRVSGKKHNFEFFATKTWADVGEYRGCAIVMRIPGSMDRYPVSRAMEMFWGDPKGMVLIGFDDVAAFVAADRVKFSVVAERKGLYV